MDNGSEPAWGPGDGVGSTTVLVADDDVDIRALLSLCLRRAGHEVLEAADGLAAWDLLTERAGDISVAVLDVSMPGYDGLELVSRCRADARLRALPTVLLTARARVQDRENGLGAGADRYITKPFSPRAIVAVVAELAAAPAPADEAEPA